MTRQAGCLWRGPCTNAHRHSVSNMTDQGQVWMILQLPAFGPDCKSFGNVPCLCEYHHLSTGALIRKYITVMNCGSFIWCDNRKRVRHFHMGPKFCAHLWNTFSNTDNVASFSFFISLTLKLRRRWEMNHVGKAHHFLLTRSKSTLAKLQTVYEGTGLLSYSLHFHKDHISFLSPFSCLT